MKTIMTLMIVCILASCSGVSEQEVEKPIVVPKATKQDHVLKGYKDKIQDAKDMEKEVLKAAERQKKAISDATN